MNSAPSSAPDAWAFEWDRFRSPTWVVAARTRATIDIEVGMSWSKGPWMEEFTVDAGTLDFRTFDQEIIAADLTFARGSAMLRAEVMLDRWGVPNVRARPTELLYNLELQRDLFAGVFAAARLGHIDFRPLSPGLQSPAQRWDYDVTRLEASLGYRLGRNAGILLSGYWQLQTVASDTDARLFGTRLWWAF